MAEAVAAILASNDPTLDDAQAVLSAWDLRANAENANAALPLLMFYPIYNARRLGEPEPSPLDTVRHAADYLRRHFARLDPPLGEVLRLRRGSVDLPLEGAPDTLRALRWTPDPDGRLRADFGDGFMMVMDWAPDGSLSTRVIHQWGASERPDSAHYADQAPMFARREWRALALDQSPTAQSE